jgi:hypothetical protein
MSKDGAKDGGEELGKAHVDGELLEEEVDVGRLKVLDKICVGGTELAVEGGEIDLWEGEGLVGGGAWDWELLDLEEDVLSRVVVACMVELGAFGAGVYGVDCDQRGAVEESTPEMGGRDGETLFEQRAKLEGIEVQGTEVQGRLWGRDAGGEERIGGAVEGHVAEAVDAAHLRVLRRHCSHAAALIQPSPVSRYRRFITVRHPPIPTQSRAHSSSGNHLRPASPLAPLYGHRSPATSDKSVTQPRMCTFRLNANKSAFRPVIRRDLINVHVSAMSRPFFVWRRSPRSFRRPPVCHWI